MVPVDEAIQCALEELQTDQDPRYHTADGRMVPIKIWKSLFEFCTKQCNFQFMGENYDQIEGLSMGNPLAPPLANLFMIKIENRALSTGLFKTRVWLHYVDDVYCILSQSDFEKLEDILVNLNQLHQSIKFTIESEVNGSLPFLNVLVSADNITDGFVTRVYRKPTNTNLYIKWDSAHPVSQKIGIFKTLLHQAKTICSTPETYEREEKLLFDIFLELNYPVSQLQMARAQVQSSSLVSHRKITKEKAMTLSIPYIPGVSEHIAKAWKKCAKMLDNPTSVVTVFKPQSKLRSLVCNLYEKEPEGRGVYKAVCGTETYLAPYIGHTGKFLTTRFGWHKRNKDSARVGMTLTVSPLNCCIKKQTMQKDKSLRLCSSDLKTLN